MSILLTAKLAPKYTDSDREHAMRQRAEMLQQTQAKNLPFSREGLKRLRSPQQDKEMQQRFLKSVGAPACAETYSGHTYSSKELLNPNAYAKNNPVAFARRNIEYNRLRRLGDAYGQLGSNISKAYSGLPSNVMHVDLSDGKEYRQAIARMKAAQK